MKAAKKAKTPLRLHSDEPLPKGIRRLARSQIDAACRFLEGGGEPHTAVHEARKALKKLRALLQLIAPEFGRKAFRAEKQRFQDAARLLAPLRDADAQVRALDGLLQSGGLATADFAEMRKPLAAATDRLARAAGRPKRRAAELLRLARGRIRRWPLDDLEWSRLAKEIRRTYRKGRKALEIHQREQTLETFHAWRKRAKELWYHLRIAQALLPEAVAERIALCGEIGEIAGNARDLALLHTTLLAQKDGVERALLIGEIEVRLPELQQAALERGTRLYAENPGAFAKRLL
ncbi:MAG: CHAD domain-containing protein [Verrucomicrobiota bacterium]